MNVDPNEGTTANAASAATVSFVSSDISVFPLANFPSPNVTVDTAADTTMTFALTAGTGDTPLPNDAADDAADGMHASAVADDTGQKLKRNKRRDGSKTASNRRKMHGATIQWQPW